MSKQGSKRRGGRRRGKAGEEEVEGGEGGVGGLVAGPEEVRRLGGEATAVALAAVANAAAGAVCW